jgi:ferric-dicitrate binding protein FerR (iron transport regulator)
MPAPDENEAWQRFRSRISYHEQHRETKKVSIKKWMGIAASITALLATAAVCFIILTRKEPAREIVFESREQVMNDTLPDASVVTLNKNSSIRYPDKFAGAVRAVILKGEAFFKVAVNKEKPFIISVNEVTVKVTGTSFNIRESNGNTEVVVETGVVEVSKNGQVVVLKQGEKVLVKKAVAVLEKEIVPDKLYNYYRSKEFVCDETPLWRLVEVLNEAYDTQIIIGNNRIRNLPITTVFMNESLDEVLNIVSQTLGINVVKKNNQTILQ